MLPISAAAPQQANLAVTIHLATPLPRPGPADIVAGYVGRPPADLLGQYTLRPQELFHAVSSYAALPPAERMPAFIYGERSTRVPVEVLSIDGFDVRVRVPSRDEVFVFDATNGEFLLGIDNSKATPAQSARCAFRNARFEAQVTANLRLCGTSAETVDTNLMRLNALLSISESARPGIIITNRAGNLTTASVRDIRGTHVLVEVTGSRPAQFVFDLAHPQYQLNFSVNEADAMAYDQYRLALQELAQPVSVHRYA